MFRRSASASVRLRHHVRRRFQPRWLSIFRPSPATLPSGTDASGRPLWGALFGLLLWGLSGSPASVGGQVPAASPAPPATAQQPASAAGAAERADTAPAGGGTAGGATAEVGPAGVAPVAIASAEAEKGRALFDGRSLEGWEVVQQFDFTEHGEVTVRDGALFLGAGDPATGIKWKGEVPKINYEIRFEAKRTEGDDFFGGLTFPVADSHCTLIMGGWGGRLTGLSMVDGLSADQGSTTTSIDYEQNRWYRVRLRVTEADISVWIDDKRMIWQDIPDHKFDVRLEVDPTRPLGFATWRTAAALRQVELIHPLPAEPAPK